MIEEGSDKPTPTEETLRELLKSGMTRTEAAERLRLPYVVVYKLTKDLRVKAFRKARSLDHEIDELGDYDEPSEIDLTRGKQRATPDPPSAFVASADEDENTKIGAILW